MIVPIILWIYSLITVPSFLSKFEEKTIPSGIEICEIQLLHLANKIKDTEVDHEIDNYLPAINEVLDGLSKEAFRTAVLKERRVELAFENHRWFDLQRTLTPSQLTAFMNAHGAQEKASPTVARGGIAFNALDYVYSDFEYYLPIPAPQILINKNLTQNPGYL